LEVGSAENGIQGMQWNFNFLIKDFFLEEHAERRRVEIPNSLFKIEVDVVGWLAVLVVVGGTPSIFGISRPSSSIGIICIISYGTVHYRSTW
jgi:hypothetical protein